MITNILKHGPKKHSVASLWAFLIDNNGQMTVLYALFVVQSPTEFAYISDLCKLKWLKGMADWFNECKKKTATQNHLTSHICIELARKDTMIHMLKQIELFWLSETIIKFGKFFFRFWFGIFTLANFCVSTWPWQIQNHMRKKIQRKNRLEPKLN